MSDTGLLKIQRDPSRAPRRSRRWRWGVAVAIGVAIAAALLRPRVPEVQLVSYGPGGITYRVKYWVPQHDREPVCRDEVLGLVDAALRARGVVLAQPLAVSACQHAEAAS